MTTCVANLEKIVINWLLKCIDKERNVEISDIKALVETLGFTATIHDKPIEKNVNVDPQVTNTFLTIVKIKEENKLKKETKVETMPLTAIFSPKSPAHNISVEVPTSSPIIQNNKLAEKLSTLMALAKDAHDMATGSNTTFTKPPFNHRRLSDIKISPLAFNEVQIKKSASVVDLNVTKTFPRTTPVKRAIIVKPDEKKIGTNSGLKKSLLQPVQSKIQSLHSKLRTPSNLKTTMSSSISRSAGANSRLTVSRTDRRLSNTPQTSTRTTPTGLSRLRLPTTRK